MKKLKLATLLVVLFANIQFANADTTFKWHGFDLKFDPFLIFLDNPYEPDANIKSELKSCEAISYGNKRKLDECMIASTPYTLGYYTGYKIKFKRQLENSEMKEALIASIDFNRPKMYRSNYREGLNYLINFNFYNLIDFDNLNQYLAENGEPPVNPANPLFVPKNTKSTSKVSAKTQPSVANKGETVNATLDDLMPLSTTDIKLSGCVTKILRNDIVIAVYSENGAKIKVKNETYNLKSLLTNKDRKSFYGEIGYIDLTIKTDDASKDKPIDFDFNGKNIDAKIVGTCKY